MNSIDFVCESNVTGLMTEKLDETVVVSQEERDQLTLLLYHHGEVAQRWLKAHGIDDYDEILEQEQRMIESYEDALEERIVMSGGDYEDLHCDLPSKKPLKKRQQKVSEHKKFKLAKKQNSKSTTDAKPKHTLTKPKGWKHREDVRIDSLSAVDLNEFRKDHEEELREERELREYLEDTEYMWRYARGYILVRKKNHHKSPYEQFVDSWKKKEKDEQLYQKLLRKYL